jgi:hypothetical protein
MAVSLPGLERDGRGRIKVSKNVVRAELSRRPADAPPAVAGSTPEAAAGTPSWHSMLSGRLVGKYDLGKHASSDGGLRSGACAAAARVPAVTVLETRVPGALPCLSRSASSRCHHARCRVADSARAAL